MVERCSAQAWLRYIEIARKYNIPVTLETIQFFRATVLYDSTITRLNRDIDFARSKGLCSPLANKGARKRVQKRMRMRLDGPTDQDYMTFEQISDSITQFVFNIGRTVENQTVHFRSIVGKISYVRGAVLAARLPRRICAGNRIARRRTLSSRFFGHKIDWASILGAVILRLGSADAGRRAAGSHSQGGAPVEHAGQQAGSDR